MSASRTAKNLMNFLSLVLVFVVILSTEARAVMFGFESITNDIVADVATGEAQLSVDVTDPGGGQVLFTFSNSGPLASSITDIYYDDGPLFGIASIDNSVLGVSFSQFATPHNLTGHNNTYPPFETTTGFSADSDPEVQPNGVNPGETVGITFDLQFGHTFDDVLAALNIGFNLQDHYDEIGGWDADNLRIGIRVQGFVGGGSESFIATPVPGAVLLGLLGLGVAGLKLRKFA